MEITLKNFLIKTLCVVLLICTILTPNVSVAQRELDSPLIAKVVTSLVQYLKWQNRSYKDNVTICTLGIDGVGSAIERLRSSHITVDKRPDMANLGKCHIVYVSITEQNQLSEILWKLKPYQVVSMSDIPGFAEAGGTIQFVTEVDKLSFKINIDSAKTAKVVIDSDLLNISEAVVN